MKKALLLIVVLALVGVAVFYTNKKPAPTVAPSVAPQEQYNYDYDKKEVFVDDASSDLAEMDKRIKDLSDQAATAADTAKAEAESKVQKLSGECAELGKKLDAVKNAKQTDWNDVKSDFQKAEDNMKTSLKETSQWLAQKTSA